MKSLAEHRLPGTPGSASGRRPAFSGLGLLLLLLLLAPAGARACRYNVRDVGFVDLETEPYHFFCFLRRTTSAETASLLRDTASTVLGGSNLSVEFVNLDEQPNHSAAALRPGPPAGDDPSAVLVSPDGQVLPVGLVRSGGVPPGEAFRAALSDLVLSPAREAIVRSVTRSFGAVLLLEGSAPDANRLARRTIAEAVEQIRTQMKSLPKPISEPPELVVIEATELARERVLLWALRQTTDVTAEPRVAILYGKARWIGPMMRGEEISVRNLAGIFSIIGADCECGLDLSWTQGTRLPVRWAPELRAPLAKALGFDPDSPMVKTEVSWILGRRSSSPAPTTTAAAAVAPQTENAGPATAMPRTAPAEPPALAEISSPFRLTWAALAGLAGAVLAAGAWIAWRASRRGRGG